IDADDCAGDRRGDLPSEEFLSDVPGILYPDKGYRMTGRRQGIDRCTLLRVRSVVDLEVDEKSVVPVMLRRRERLLAERYDAPPILARALCEQLLQPGSQITDRRRSHDRDLVSVEAGGGHAQCDTELYTG